MKSVCIISLASTVGIVGAIRPTPLQQHENAHRALRRDGDDNTNNDPPGNAASVQMDAQDEGITIEESEAYWLKADLEERIAIARAGGDSEEALRLRKGLEWLEKDIIGKYFPQLSPQGF